MIEAFLNESLAFWFWIQVMPKRWISKLMWTKRYPQKSSIPVFKRFKKFFYCSLLPFDSRSKFQDRNDFLAKWIENELLVVENVLPLLDDPPCIYEMNGITTFLVDVLNPDTRKWLNVIRVDVQKAVHPLWNGETKLLMIPLRLGPWVKLLSSKSSVQSTAAGHVGQKSSAHVGCRLAEIWTLIPFKWSQL